MLMIPCELRPSGIDGVGVFTLVDIPKGKVVWRFDPIVDRLIARCYLESLTGPARDFMFGHAYESTKRAGMWVLCGDMMGYQNHASVPNCIDVLVEGDGENDTVAACDIPAGTELTGNYLDFDANAILKPFVRVR